MNSSELPGVADVRAAAARIAPYVLRTPVVSSDALDALAGASLHFKCENLQRGGAFKLRGACNAVFALDDAQARHGVATHSSGNHGAALARAAKLRGIACHVVVPRGSVASKVRNIEEQGATLSWCEPTLAAREAALAQIVARTGATAVHPYNDARVIAGQGTAALELLEDAPGLEVLVAPVGGGGLLSGTALAAQGQAQPPQVLGAEPAGADDAYQSLARGERVTDIVPATIADGLRATIGPLNFALIRAHVAAIVRVEEAEIVAAMRLAWERLHLVIEPSSAVALAAVLRDRARFADRRVGVILSGGNVDLEHLPWQK